MNELSAQRPTWAAIHLDRLAFNFRSAKAFIGPELKYMAVVKANAYGHGAVECARVLEAEGADWLAVALPEEGIELRHAGIRKPVLCFGGFWEGQEDVSLSQDLTPVVFHIDRARALDTVARRHGMAVSIHIKIDTGMGRIGVRYDEVLDFIGQLKQLEHLRVEGLMTHFAAADDLAHNDFTNLQIKRFNDAVGMFREKGYDPAYLDLANSPGAVVHPESRGNMVRLGGVLYGLSGDVLPAGARKPDLRPVMSLHTRIAQLKKVPTGETIGYGRTFTTTADSIIASIPIGYHDGLARRLSNIGFAIVRDHKVPVAGRISMDWTTLDVTGVEGVRIGDEVILIGDGGGACIKAEDIAASLDTISYEVTCGIDRRVPRVYIS